MYATIALVTTLATYNKSNGNAKRKIEKKKKIAHTHTVREMRNNNKILRITAKLVERMLVCKAHVANKKFNDGVTNCAKANKMKVS